MKRQYTQREAEPTFATRWLAEDLESMLPRGSRRRRATPRDGLAAAEHKTMQLCRQVAVTLDEALAECGDPLLQGLHVLNVKPAPDTSRLMVTLTTDDDEPAAALAMVETHLARAAGHLRGEVAQAITRKRAPALVYVLAPGETGA